MRELLESGERQSRAARPTELDQLAQLFVDAFPVLNEDEQRLGRRLLRLLAEGQPVAVARLAEALEQPATAIEARLRGWPDVVFDETSAIVGFAGLTVRPTSHRVAINGHTAYTWCAWDTLFLPELIGAPMQVSDHCATSGLPIRLTIGPAGIESVQPKGIVMSFLAPDAQQLRVNVVAHFCCHVHFFRALADGQAWIGAHPGTFVLSLDEAYRLGRQVNRRRFNRLLSL
jgi:alkylmercury lyase